MHRPATGVGSGACEAASRERWHISRGADLVLYHWGWVLAVVAFMIAERLPNSEAFKMTIIAVIAGFAFAHRHLTLVYAYCDSKVRRSRSRTLLLVPILSLVFFLAVIALNASSSPDPSGSGRQLARAIMLFVVAVTVPWNAWHILMQKYGILRKYSALGLATGLDFHVTPRWVDKLYLFGWIPLMIYLSGPRIGGFLSEVTLQRHVTEQTGLSLASLITAPEGYFASPVICALSWLLFVASLCAILYWEGFRNRFRSVPRLSALAANSSLLLLFLIYEPLLAYVALVFSHALEYVAFVMRERAPAVRDPAATSGPRASSALYLLCIGLLPALYLVFSGAQLQVFSTFSLALIFSWWAGLEALAHFYLDGVLWRRKPGG